MPKTAVTVSFDKKEISDLLIEHAKKSAEVKGGGATIKFQIGNSADSLEGCTVEFTGVGNKPVK